MGSGIAATTVGAAAALLVGLSVVPLLADGPLFGQSGEVDAAASASASCTRHVAARGSDRDEGTAAAPWRTLGASFERLAPGDTLCIGAGTYDAPDVSVPSGSPEARITVQPEGGTTPVVVGPSSIVDPDHWTLRGLKWTAPGSDERIVSILGGTGWVFEDNEVTDGDYAGLLVGKSERFGAPQDYTIRRNSVHDTAGSNLYLNPGRDSRGGLVERNLFFTSQTQNVKLGWGGDGACSGHEYDTFGIGEVVVRYNTLHGAAQPLDLAEPGGEEPVTVYRNLITGGTRGFAVRLDGVEGCLRDNVRIVDNLADGGSRFVEDFGDAAAIRQRMSGNAFPHDPRFDSIGVAGFHPQDDTAKAYGRYAAG